MTALVFIAGLGLGLLVVAMVAAVVDYVCSLKETRW